jgi:hypothetical protein
MLTCMANGEKVLARELTREMAQGLNLRCPGCNGQVRYKEGPIVKAHFAHVVKSDCTFAYESEIHTQSKLQIYNHFVSKFADNPGVQVELEHFVSNGVIKRRADIFLRIGSDAGIAIEIQNSRLDVEECLIRSQDWNALGAAVWWIIPTHFNSELDHSELDFVPFGESLRMSKGQYALKPWQKQIAAMNCGPVKAGGSYAHQSLWFYDPFSEELERFCKTVIKKDYKFKTKYQIVSREFFFCPFDHLKLIEKDKDFNPGAVMVTKGLKVWC